MVQAIFGQYFCIFQLTKYFGGQNFQWTKFFGGRNFRQKARFSALMSAEILSDKVLWYTWVVFGLPLQNQFMICNVVKVLNDVVGSGIEILKHLNGLILDSFSGVGDSVPCCYCPTINHTTSASTRRVIEASHPYIVTNLIISILIITANIFVITIYTLKRSTLLRTPSS